MSIDLVTYFEEAVNHPTDSLPAELKRYFARIPQKDPSLLALPADIRKHVRRKFNETLLAIRVNEHDQPCGQFFQIFVKDISAGGLGFVHTRAFSHERLAI